MVSFITFNHKGNFNNAERFFNRMLRRNYLNILEHYGQMGVEALKNATPSDSGKTAESWHFGIEQKKGMVTLYWTNSNVNQGVNIAILLIYGHALRNGTYIQGVDFVTPAMRPIFEKIAHESWKEVIR